MNDIKQASIYLRVIWLNDNENLRPDDINIKLDGENTEEVVFSISQSDNSIGNNAPWEVNNWANGITYNYKKEPQKQSEIGENDIEEQVISNIPYVIPSIVDNTNIKNYRKNIIKNAETEEYSYYTIKMTYVPPKRKLMARNLNPSIIMNGTQIENVNFNGTEIDTVVFNGVTVFEKATTPLFKDIILANSTLNEGTPNFSLTATTDEGMFETEDDDGTTYYFRGNVTNNWVQFAGFYWRIIRINGDGTIRMIYNGTSTTTTGDTTQLGTKAFNSTYNSAEYVGIKYTMGSQHGTGTNSTILGTGDSTDTTTLNGWYNSKIKGTQYEKYVETNGKFCSDRNVASGHSSYPGTTGTGKTATAFAPADRLMTANISSYKTTQTPTLKCASTNDRLTMPVGINTSDENIFGGGLGGTENRSYYLYNNQVYWTMSPHSYSGGARIFAVGTNGVIAHNYVNKAYGVRPVINLKADVQVTGTGTIDDPYVVGE